MKKHLFLIILSVLTIVTLCGLVPMFAAQSSGSPVALENYAHSDGTVYFEFGLKIPQANPSRQNEVVFLFDTSASQVGPVRREQFAILKSAVEQLPRGTQVQLFSFDLNTVPYTRDFMDAGSADLQKAIATLESKSVPLGSADLEKGLQSVLTVFENHDNESAQRTIIYIGDGLNSTRGISQARLENLVNRLVDSKISFSGTAIGAGSQLGLPGTLAYRTGGFLVDPGHAAERFSQGTASTVIAAEIGSQLGKSVNTTVLWPEESSVAFSEDWEIYPQVLPPLRSDRETLVFGKTTEKMIPAQLNMTVVNAQGESQDRSWNLKPQTPQTENQYLVQLVESAAYDNGLSLPFANRELLQQVRNASLIHDEENLEVAEVALLSGQSESAARIARQVQARSDDSNLYASDLLDRANRQLSMEPGNGEIAVAGPVDAYAKSGSIRIQSLTNTVNVAIAESEKLMVERPDLALQHLKLLRAEIRQATDIPPNVRNKMIERIENKVRSVYRQEQIIEARRIEEEAVEAERISKALLVNNIFRREEKAKQLMERFGALVDANQHQQAIISADAARSEVPYSTAPPTASFYARANQVIYDVEEMKVLRERAIVDVFYTAERIFIPLTDEPPMLWPKPEIWNALSERRKDRYDIIDVSNPSESARKIKRALDSTITYAPNEDEETLGQFIDFIRDKYGINVDIDRQALEDIDVSIDASIRGIYTGLPLRIVLKRILKDISEDVSYTIQDDLLLITSKDNIQADIVKIYSISDTMRASGMGGGMGGMGGGMMGGMGGGMMGGMGGGMMGGMGGGMMGGMGGMGGGMMGGMGGMMGGFMDRIPSSYDKLLRRSMYQNMQQNQPNLLFAVVDRPQTQTKNKPRISQPVTKPMTKEVSPEALVESSKVAGMVADEGMTKIINLKVIDPENPEVYWEKVFSVPLEQRPNELELANTVHTLFKKAVRGDVSSAKQISTMLECAIRYGEVHPWMYESLAVALNLQDAPIAEVERAILSAQDLCQDPMDMLLLAVYLEQFGLHARALELYKNVAAVYPMRPEPYARALKLAEELEAEEAIEVLTLSIAGQVWEGVWARTIQKAGLDLAVTHWEKLRQAGRLEDAKRYETALKEARRKDCVVIVEYTGDALLDLAVKEPAETYCWFVNPRTTSGGILLNASESMQTEYGENPGNIKRIVYLCPQAFSGNYEVLVQSVFGKIANNKFRVKVLTNDSEGQPLISDGYYELGEEGSLVKFTLENGRLNESLKEAEMEAGLVRETALMNRMILSQQIAAMSNRTVIANINNSASTTRNEAAAVRNDGTTSGGGNMNTGGTYVDDAVLSNWMQARRGGTSAVGYAPQISVLPSGAMLMAYPIISSDRRYVTITPTPQFTQVKGVRSFNTATGSSGGTGGMGGMGGMGGGMGGMGGMSGF